MQNDSTSTDVSHSPQNQDSFARLRHALSDEVSIENWLEILICLEEWNDEDTLLLGVQYAEKHLNDWDDSYKSFSGYQPEHPGWKLAKNLFLYAKHESTYDILLHCEHFSTLSISGFHELQDLKLLENFPNLTFLSLKECSELHSIKGAEKISHLKTLYIEDCGIDDGPEGLQPLLKMPQLQNIRLGTFDSPDLELFRNIQQLKSLEILYSWNLKDLRALKHHTDLTTLVLNCCHEIREITPLLHLKKLEELELDNCTELEDISVIGELCSLQSLKITWAYSPFFLEHYLGEGYTLEECVEERGEEFSKISKGFETIKQLSNLKVLDLSGQIAFDEGLFSGLTSLEKLILRKCNGLQKPQGLETLIHLRELDLTECSLLQELVLAKHPFLEDIQLDGNHKLNKIHIEHAPELRTLDFQSCGELNDVKLPANMPKLEELHIGYTEYELQWPWQEMRELRSLSTSDLAIEDLQSFVQLTKLEDLTIHSESSHGRKKLKSLKGIEHLQHLVFLDLQDCTQLQSIQAIKQLHSLEELSLPLIVALKHITFLQTLKQLKTLELNIHLDHYIQHQQIPLTGTQWPIFQRRDIDPIPEAHYQYSGTFQGDEIAKILEQLSEIEP